LTDHSEDGRWRSPCSAPGRRQLTPTAKARRCSSRSPRNACCSTSAGALVCSWRASKSAGSIDALFITHHHFDHIGDLGALLIDVWSSGRTQPLHVFGPPGTAALVDTLIEQLYKRHIDFRYKQAAAIGRAIPKISDLIIVQDCVAGLICARPAWQVYAADVEHGHRLGLTREQWPCFGYRLEGGGKALAISGDTVACAGVDWLAREADLLIQCCYSAEQEVNSPAEQLLARDVIATAAQAGQIAARGQVRKLVLTHFEQKSPELLQAMVADVRRHYDGEIALAEDLMTIAL
jgi:ribonuclease BN (tRNA processing enzyme)